MHDGDRVEDDLRNQRTLAVEKEQTRLKPERIVLAGRS